MKKLIGVFVAMVGMSLTARAADDVHKLDARLTAAKATIDEISPCPTRLFRMTSHGRLSASAWCLAS